ncbi:hypothetical protein B0O80DRAFT_10507 [Mortierella sp. GBAus27b]|nr:hypothetical protein B0O80DRAFT_10507 [Mortierella sp. GBAus27b]
MLRSLTRAARPVAAVLARTSPVVCILHGRRSMTRFPCGAWRARSRHLPCTDHPSLFDQHHGSLEGLHLRSQDGTLMYKITNYHGTCGLMIKKTCHLRGSGNGGAGIKSGEVSTADLLYSVTHKRASVRLLV